jgi:hypothetical protein
VNDQRKDLPDWERLLAAERHVQHIVPAWLLATRHTVRDYLDTVVLFERLGTEGVQAALRSFDAIYRQPNDASPLSEVAERLAAATPSDLAHVDLGSYRKLQAPWNRWAHVAERGRAWAPLVARGRARQA